MPAKKKKPRGPRTLVTVRHNPNALKEDGYEQRREECIALAWRGKIDGDELETIAENIRQKMGLVEKPNKSTVKRWIDSVFEDKRGTTLALREEFLIVEMRRIDMIIAKHLPLATDMALMVDRYVMMEGERVKVVDENGHKEQTKSAEIVLKAIETKRRMLGVGLSQGQESDTPQISIVQLNTLIAGAAGKSPLPPGAEFGERLLVAAGDPNIEGL